MKNTKISQLRTFLPLLRIRVLRSPFMPVRSFIVACIVICAAIPLVMSCGEKQSDKFVSFTKTDSLTETYLSLQDSMLQTWNLMIKDDNRKLESMHNLLHELEVSGGCDPGLLANYKERLDQLKKARYTQKTMGNGDIVEEYDFASSALISELIALAESQKQFAYNTTLQQLVDNIRTADQRVPVYREDYDLITSRYNEFIEENRKFLKEIDADTVLEKKPVFRMESEQ